MADLEPGVTLSADTIAAMERLSTPSRTAMTKPHPITPSPELVQQWTREYDRMDPRPNIEPFIATEAAQWGADQELEALLVWLRVKGFDNLASDLLSARRPKPPSLKEQALEQLGCIQTDLNKFGMGISTDTIRRALEALDD